MSHISNSQPQKYAWIDLTRAIGAFFVILIHVSGTYTDLFKSLDLFNWTAAIFWNVIPRSGVPLFIAVSGYVLLEKQDNTIKRIYKLLQALIFWSLFYLLLALALNSQNNVDFIKELLLKGLLGIWSIGNHLWFLYMLLGLYLSLPISRLLYKYLDSKETAFLAAAFLLNSLIHHITSIWNLIGGEQVSSLYSKGLGWGSIYFGYFLLPKLIVDRKYFIFKNAHLLLAIIITNLIALLLASLTILNCKCPSQAWSDPDSIFIIIQTFSIVLLLHSNEHKIEQVFSKFVGLKKIIEISSRYALGIYAIHWFFVRLIFYVIDRTSLKESLHHFLWIAIIAISIFVWISSLLASLIMSKNSFLKQVV
jgi:surface polysaccharide O-acyltransferase-like enzyme